MKKKLSVLLCAAMVATSLAGCGGSSGAKTETTAAEASQGGQESATEGKILTYAISGEPEKQWKTPVARGWARRMSIASP